MVSTARASILEWQSQFSAVGTLSPVRGADLALDSAGLVPPWIFESGQDVKAGELLLQLRDSEDFAQLGQLEAAAALAGSPTTATSAARRCRP